MNPFSIEDQYKFYLEKCKVNEEQMHPIQRQETKRAFYGAAGQMLLTLCDELSLLDEEEAIKQLQNMRDQVLKFWKEEARKERA